MKLLRVKASHFKNCQDDTVIDLVAKSKNTTDYKEYEHKEIAEGIGLKLNTTLSKYHRALAKLRKYLTEGSEEHEG